MPEQPAIPDDSFDVNGVCLLSDEAIDLLADLLLSIPEDTQEGNAE